MPAYRDYARLLETWIPYFDVQCHKLPGSDDLVIYGAGTEDHWAVQAHATAMCAPAVLWQDPALDERRVGWSREALGTRARSMLRCMLQAHVSNEGHCVTGKSWGHTWIACLAIERMMHAVNLLELLLTDHDREEIRRMLTSEADWLTREEPLKAGLISSEGKNAPESNMWNGCLLYRTAAMYPDAGQRDRWIESAHRYLINSISIPSDADCDERFLDRPVRDWHIGANFFESYACNHHGYLNVGYMVITLSNLAMLHFDLKSRGLTGPAALYRHARELWSLVKQCTFPDGRLLRIGGDTRARYCYCQDYAIPVWLLARDVFDDAEGANLETGWLDLVRREQEHNTDGSFLGTRLAKMGQVAPIYRLRLEGDRACSLSMGANWRRQFAGQWSQAPERQQVPIKASWTDEYHHAAFQRGSNRAASWVWRAADPPQGLCVPLGDSSTAEWRTNLAGRVMGLGQVHKADLKCSALERFEGGFITCGSYAIGEEKPLHEAAGETWSVARVDLCFAALPDDATVVVFQRAVLDHPQYLRELKGLFLQVPNDLFNESRRTCWHAAGKLVLPSCPGTERRHDIEGGWLNIDNVLGVLKIHADGPLTIWGPAERQVHIKNNPAVGGSLYVDEICLGCETETTFHDDTMKPLFDVGAVILAGVDAGTTRTFAEDASSVVVETLSGDRRAVRLRGQNGRFYRVSVDWAAGTCEHTCL